MRNMRIEKSLLDSLQFSFDVDCFEDLLIWVKLLMETFKLQWSWLLAFSHNLLIIGQETNKQTNKMRRGQIVRTGPGARTHSHRVQSLPDRGASIIIASQEYYHYFVLTQIGFSHNFIVRSYICTIREALSI